jgi:hypothetical protein
MGRVAVQNCLTVKMEAVQSFETSGTTCPTTQHRITQDLTLQVYICMLQGLPPEFSLKFQHQPISHLRAIHQYNIYNACRCECAIHMMHAKARIQLCARLLV